MFWFFFCCYFFFFFLHVNNFFSTSQLCTTCLVKVSFMKWKITKKLDLGLGGSEGHLLWCELKGQPLQMNQQDFVGGRGGRLVEALASGHSRYSSPESTNCGGAGKKGL